MLPLRHITLGVLYGNDINFKEQCTVETSKIRGLYCGLILKKSMKKSDMSSFASIQCKLILHNLISKPPSWIKNLNTKFHPIIDPSFPLFFFFLFLAILLTPENSGLIWKCWQLLKVEHHICNTVIMPTSKCSKENKIFLFKQILNGFSPRIKSFRPKRTVLSMLNQSCTKEMWKEINANWFYSIYVIRSTSLLFSIEWVKTRLTLLLWCLFDWLRNSIWIKESLDVFLHACPAWSQSTCLSK